MTRPTVRLSAHVKTGGLTFGPRPATWKASQFCISTRLNVHKTDWGKLPGAIKSLTVQNNCCCPTKDTDAHELKAFSQTELRGLSHDNGETCQRMANRYNG